MQKSYKNRSILMKNNLEAKQETRRCIKSALMKLLKEKKYGEIRMTDIIRKSGVSRMGVYNNYKSKYEIILDLYRKPVEHIFSLLDVSIRADLKYVFTTAYRHKDAILTLIDANLTHIILDMMNERFKDTPPSFFYTIGNGFIYNSVIEWVRSGTDESPESAIARMEVDLHLLAKSIESGKISKIG